MVDTEAVDGAGKGAAGWFDVSTATVAYDHPSHGNEEHALLLDFANYDLLVDTPTEIRSGNPASVSPSASRIRI